MVKYLNSVASGPLDCSSCEDALRGWARPMAGVNQYHSLVLRRKEAGSAPLSIVFFQVDNYFNLSMFQNRILSYSIFKLTLPNVYNVMLL